MSKVQRFRPAGASAPVVVLASDYDYLEAEIKALLADKYKDTALIHKLRTEISDLRSKGVVVPEPLHVPVAPGFSHAFGEGWNACLDELAHLNGKTVSAGLLYRIAETLDDVCHGSALEKELRALLDEV